MTAPAKARLEAAARAVCVSDTPCDPCPQICAACSQFAARILAAADAVDPMRRNDGGADE